MRSRADIEAANRRGMLIMLGCAGAVGAIGVGLWLGKPEAKEMATQCGAGSQTHTIVIADTSDGFRPAQLATLQAAIRKLSNAVAKGDRLSIYVFSGEATKSSPQAAFEKCKGDDGSDSSGLTTTVSKLKQAHLANWQQPLDKVLESLAKATHTRSELTRFISDVAGLNSYATKGQRTRIVLYSNLEENSSISFFQKKPALTPVDFSTFFKQTVQDRLQNIALEIVYVPAPTTTPAMTKRTKAAWAQALSGVTFKLGDL